MAFSFFILCGERKLMNHFLVTFCSTMLTKH